MKYDLEGITHENAVEIGISGGRFLIVDNHDGSNINSSKDFVNWWEKKSWKKLKDEVFYDEITELVNSMTRNEH